MADLFMIEDVETFGTEETITATELERLQVDENLQGVARVQYLLKFGLPSQKKSIVNNVQKYLAFDYSKEGLDVVLASLLELKDKAQNESDVIDLMAIALKQLITADSDGRITSYERDTEFSFCSIWTSVQEAKKVSYLIELDSLMDKIGPWCLQLLSEIEKEPHLSVMTDTIVALASRKLDKEFVDKMLGLALKKGDIVQPIHSRKSSCRILGAIARYSKDKVVDSMHMMMPKVVELCQDTNAAIRKCMADELIYIGNLNSTVEDNSEIFGEMIELFGDEELEVQIAAFRTAVILLDAFYQDAVATPIALKIVEVVKEIPEGFEDILAESLGILLHVCKRSTQDSQFMISSMHSCFIQLSKSDETEVRRWCAFNIPAIIESYNESKYMEALFETHKTLAMDKEISIRMAVASGAITHMTSKTSIAASLREIMFTLLEDDIVHVQCKAIESIANLGNAFTLVGNEPRTEILNRIVLASVGISEKIDRAPWRIGKAFVDALYSFAEWIPCSQLFEHIIPVLFRILHATSRPVQLAACRALLWYTRKSSNSAHRHMNISKIKGDFAKGYSSWERLLYLEACQISLEFNSSKYVKQIFVDAAVELVMDPIPNVRRSAILLLPTWHSMIEKSGDEKLIKSLDALNISDQTDADPDVQAAIIKVRERIAEIGSSRPLLNEVDAKLMDEETKAGMGKDNESSSLDAKYSDLFEYTFTVNKDGTVARRARVKSLDLGQPNGTSIKSSTKSDGKKNGSRSKQGGHQLPHCAGSRSSISSVVHIKTEVKSARKSTLDKSSTITRIPQIAQPVRPSQKSPQSSNSTSNKTVGRSNRGKEPRCASSTTKK